MINHNISFRAWDGQEMQYDIAVGSHSLDAEDADSTVVRLDNGECCIWQEAPTPIMQYSGFNDEAGEKLFDGDLAEIGGEVCEIVMLDGCWSYRVRERESFIDQLNLVGKQYANANPAIKKVGTIFDEVKDGVLE